MQLEGANALVTGGSRGLGPHIARALSSAGCAVAVSARSAASLAPVVAAIEARGGRALAAAADLARPEDWPRLIAEVERGLGPLDLLVNNAGLESEGRFLALDQATVAGTVQVNLVAPMELARRVLPGMLERGRGAIVNIASIGAKSGAPYDAVYCATKAGLAEWAKALRLELAATPVRVLTLFPGYVTGEGMFARFGVTPPWAIGSTTPERVARAVVRAVRSEQPEMVVNSRPLRPFFALAELSPRLGDRLVHLLGVVRFQRRKVGRG